eukprot:95150_1
MVSQAGFLAVIVGSTVVGIPMFFLFCFLRTRFPYVFSPRAIILRRQDFRQRDPRRPIQPLPPNLPNSFFGWIPAVYNITEEEVVELAGLDALLFLRMIRIAMQIFLASSVWNILVLFPLYYTGANHAHAKADDWNNNILYHLSLSNITLGNWRLWGPTISVCITTAIVLLVLHRNFTHMLKLRSEHQTRQLVHNYTIMCTRLPSRL